MKKLILSAGMPRSGSTWLYNAMRILLRSTGIDLGAGWIQDFNTFKDHDFVLMKIHNYEPVVVPKASFVAYSYRDLRDSLASMKRKFKVEPNIKLADEFIADDIKWRENASFVMKYEDFLKDPEKVVSELALAMQIPCEDPGALCKEINTLDYKSSGDRNSIYNKENLLHEGHITAGDHGSWKRDLDIELVKEVEEKYSEWFNKNNYSVL